MEENRMHPDRWKHFFFCVLTYLVGGGASLFILGGMFYFQRQGNTFLWETVTVVTCWAIGGFGFGITHAVAGAFYSKYKASGGSF